MSEHQKLPLIIAHRGSSAIAPENTLAAFRQAIKDGADGLEFDVQLAKDDVPVVFHDPTLHRMTKSRKRISSLTFSELQNANVGAWFNRKYPAAASEEFNGETISTLTEIFEFLRDYQGRIYVELKCREKQIPALVKAVVKDIQSTELLPKIVLKSFTLEAVREAKKLLPELCTAALFAPKLTAPIRLQNRLIEQAKKFSADELSLHYSLATEKMLEKTRSENTPVTIWTADNPVWVERAVKTGIYAIITNTPAQLLQKKKDIFNAEK